MTSNKQSSQNEWFGDIPKDWTVCRNIGLFSERNEKNFPDLNLLSVTIKKGVIKQTELTTKKDTSNEDKTSYKRVLPGDLVYNKMRMWQGAVGLSDYKGIVSPAYIVLKPKKLVHPKYFHYLFRTKRFNQEAYRHGYGITDDQHSLRFYQFKAAYSPVPPKNTQIKISNYLNQKIDLIDRLIQKNKRLIKLLEEKRQAIITQAVTKGLDSNVEMKDSGIEWIGKIPKHWIVKKLKFVCKINPLKLNYDGSKNIYVTFLPMEKVDKDGSFNGNEKKKFGDVADGFVYFENGDVLVAKITPCFENGKGAHVFGLVNGIGFGSTEFHVLRPNDQIISDYLYFITSSSLFRKLGESSMVGAAGQKRVPVGFISNFKIGIPKKEEQKNIVKYLKKELKKYDGLFKKIETQNKKLEEYRQALISNAVTGKIKI